MGERGARPAAERRRRADDDRQRRRRQGEAQQEPGDPGGEYRRGQSGQEQAPRPHPEQQQRGQRAAEERRGHDEGGEPSRRRPADAGGEPLHGAQQFQREGVHGHRGVSRGAAALRGGRGGGEAAVEQRTGERQVGPRLRIAGAEPQRPFPVEHGVAQAAVAELGVPQVVVERRPVPAGPRRRTLPGGALGANGGLPEQRPPDLRGLPVVAGVVAAGGLFRIPCSRIRTRVPARIVGGRRRRGPETGEQGERQERRGPRRPTGPGAAARLADLPGDLRLEGADQRRGLPGGGLVGGGGGRPGGVAGALRPGQERSETAGGLRGGARLHQPGGGVARRQPPGGDREPVGGVGGEDPGDRGRRFRAFAPDPAESRERAAGGALPAEPRRVPGAVGAAAQEEEHRPVPGEGQRQQQEEPGARTPWARGRGDSGHRLQVADVLAESLHRNRPGGSRRRRRGALDGEFQRIRCRPLVLPGARVEGVEGDLRDAPDTADFGNERELPGLPPAEGISAAGGRAESEFRRDVRVEGAEGAAELRGVGEPRGSGGAQVPGAGEFEAQHQRLPGGRPRSGEGLPLPEDLGAEFVVPDGPRPPGGPPGGGDLEGADGHPRRVAHDRRPVGAEEGGPRRLHQDLEARPRQHPLADPGGEDRPHQDRPGLVGDAADRAALPPRPGEFPPPRQRRAVESLFLPGDIGQRHLLGPETFGVRHLDGPGGGHRQPGVEPVEDEHLFAHEDLRFAARGAGRLHEHEEIPLADFRFRPRAERPAVERVEGVERRTEEGAEGVAAGAPGAEAAVLDPHHDLRGGREPGDGDRGDPQVAGAPRAQGEVPLDGLLHPAVHQGGAEGAAAAGHVEVVEDRQFHPVPAVAGDAHREHQFVLDPDRVRVHRRLRPLLGGRERRGADQQQGGQGREPGAH